MAGGGDSTVLPGQIGWALTGHPLDCILSEIEKPWQKSATLESLHTLADKSLCNF